MALASVLEIKRDPEGPVLISISAGERDSNRIQTPSQISKLRIQKTNWSPGIPRKPIAVTGVGSDAITPTIRPKSLFIDVCRSIPTSRRVTLEQSRRQE